MLISSEKKLQQKYKQSNLYGKLSKAKRLKENYLRCQDLDLNCLYLLPSRHTLDINATN